MEATRPLLTATIPTSSRSNDLVWTFDLPNRGLNPAEENPVEIFVGDNWRTGLHASATFPATIFLQVPQLYKFSTMVALFEAAGYEVAKRSKTASYFLNSFLKRRWGSSSSRHPASVRSLSVSNLVTF